MLAQPFTEFKNNSKIKQNNTIQNIIVIVFWCVMNRGV